MLAESWEEYNSNETGAYIKFLLWLGCRDLCEKCQKAWGFGTNYPSDEQKHYGFKRKGMEAFF